MTAPSSEAQLLEQPICGLLSALGQRTVAAIKTVFAQEIVDYLTIALWSSVVVDQSYENLVQNARLAWGVSNLRTACEPL